VPHLVPQGQDSTFWRGARGGVKSVQGGIAGNAGIRSIEFLRRIFALMVNAKLS
jgi:hypothetical protein